MGLRPVFGVLLVLAAAVSDLAVGEEALMAGAARRSIVPPFPTQLGGYLDRTSKWTDVKTPVHVRALVVQRGEMTVGIVTLDLLNVSRALTDAVRERVTAETGISGDHLLISAAHNHSAPAGFTPGLMFGGEYSKPLFEFLTNEISGAVKDAHGSKSAAVLGHGRGRLDSISRNRHQDNASVIDPEVNVLRVQRADSREVIGTLFNFTAHPVILGSDNLLVCGEYPGTAQTFVENAVGGVALFTQGACGDVTIVRSGDPYLEVERIGRVLASEVIKTAEQIRTDGSNAALASRLEEVAVEPRAYPTIAEAKSALEAAQKSLQDAKAANGSLEQLRKLQRAADSAEWALRLVTYRAEHPEVLKDVVSAPLQVMRVGPMAVVGVPGELFVEYGLEIKGRVQKLTGLPVMIAGYANDYIGYIVTPQAVATGGYEQATARVAPSAGRTMVEAAVDWITTMVQAESGMAGAQKAFVWPEGKRIALSLTFDDGRPSQVERGLPILDRHGAKATFYVLPSSVKKNLEGWQRVVASGHEIANHTDTHPCSGNFQFSRANALENYTLIAIEDEMDRCTAQIHSLLGVTTQNFAYPCGQMYVGRGRGVQSYVPVVARKFVTGRGYMGEGANTPMFCDLAQLYGVNFDGMTFEQALGWIEKAKNESGWLVLAGHDIGPGGHQVVLEETLHKVCKYALDPANGIWLDTVQRIGDYVVSRRDEQ